MWGNKMGKWIFILAFYSGAPALADWKQAQEEYVQISYDWTRASLNAGADLRAKIDENLAEIKKLEAFKEQCGSYSCVSDLNAQIKMIQVRNSELREQLDFILHEKGMTHPFGVAAGKLFAKALLENVRDVILKMDHIREDKVSHLTWKDVEQYYDVYNRFIQRGIIEYKVTPVKQSPYWVQRELFVGLGDACEQLAPYCEYSRPAFDSLFKMAPEDFEKIAKDIWNGERCENLVRGVNDDGFTFTIFRPAYSIGYYSNYRITK